MWKKSMASAMAFPIRVWRAQRSKRDGTEVSIWLLRSGKLRLGTERAPIAPEPLYGSMALLWQWSK